jgi:small-conductance mechanosensitive channel
MSEPVKKALNKSLELLIIFVVFILINKIFDIVIDRFINRNKNKNFKTIMSFFKRLKKIVLYTICVIICLSKFAIFSTLSVTILSGIGIITTVVGLAAKDLLTDFFASLCIVFDGPYKIGDVIHLLDIDVTGTVEEITMRHTIIRTIYNKRVIIPNSSMNTKAIENLDKVDNEICVFGEYPISYDSDVDKALKILSEETGKLYTPVIDTEFPKVRVISWDPSSITLRTWIWGADVANANENRFKLNYIIKKRFNEEGIEIPYEHVNVIMKK